VTEKEKETVTLVNSDGELTIQTEGSVSEWITADRQSVVIIKQ
jgi:hypothetical protein